MYKLNLPCPCRSHARRAKTFSSRLRYRHGLAPWSAGRRRLDSGRRDWRAGGPVLAGPPPSTTPDDHADSPACFPGIRADAAPATGFRAAGAAWRRRMTSGARRRRAATSRYAATGCRAAGCARRPRECGREPAAIFHPWTRLRRPLRGGEQAHFGGAGRQRDHLAVAGDNRGPPAGAVRAGGHHGLPDAQRLDRALAGRRGDAGAGGEAQHRRRRAGGHERVLTVAAQRDVCRHGARKLEFDRVGAVVQRQHVWRQRTMSWRRNAAPRSCRPGGIPRSRCWAPLPG